MSPTIRQEAPMADADAIIAFLHANVNPQMDRQTYSWQFEQLPFPPVLMVARDNGVIVSTQSFLPHVLIQGERELDTLKSEHSFLSSAFRGTPVFTDAYAAGLAICADQGRTVCWGYTPAVKVWRDRLGFHVYPGLMHECMTMLAPSPLFTDLSLRSVVRAFGERVRHWRFRPEKPASRRPPSWDMETDLHPADGSVEDLYRRTCDEHYRLRMDRRFLDWRVYRNPNLAFTCRYFFKQDVLVACYMFAIHPARPDLVHLSEFMHVDPADGEALMECLHKDVLHAGARSVQYFGNSRCALNQRVFALLKNAGPSQEWSNEGMAYVLKDPQGSTDTDPAKWYMTALWTQGFAR